MNGLIGFVDKLISKQGSTSGNNSLCNYVWMNRITIDSTDINNLYPQVDVLKSIKDFKYDEDFK